MLLAFLLKKLGLKFSLKDPQWGRGSKNENNVNPDPNVNKPEENPSDIDQLWRNFNYNLIRMFSRRSKNNNKNSGEDFSRRGFRGTSFIISLIIITILLLWLASGFFIVQEGQTAVVMTFGKYQYTTLPGFNWRWPYPVQSHEIVNISQVRTTEIGYRSNAKNKQLKESLMLTDDENIIDIQFAVQYTLKHAADWLFSNREPDETVRQVAETAIREVVGRNKMDFVLYEGREKVALDINFLMQKILDRYKSGVHIANVTMQGVQPPEQVQAAFDDAVKAGQDRERQKNEGQAYANNVIPRASGDASRFLQEAEAYRARIIATAEGDAARFKQVLEEYRKAPTVTRDRMYLETMQKIFSRNAKILLDSQSKNNVLYFSLDRFIPNTSNVNAINKTRSPLVQKSLHNESTNLVKNNTNMQSAGDSYRNREER